MTTTGNWRGSDRYKKTKESVDEVCQCKGTMRQEEAIENFRGHSSPGSD